MSNRVLCLFGYERRSPYLHTGGLSGNVDRSSLHFIMAGHKVHGIRSMFDSTW